MHGRARAGVDGGMARGATGRRAVRDRSESPASPHVSQLCSIARSAYLSACSLRNACDLLPPPPSLRSRHTPTPCVRPFLCADSSCMARSCSRTAASARIRKPAARGARRAWKVGCGARTGRLRSTAPRRRPLVGRAVLLPVAAVGAAVFLGVLVRRHDVDHVHGHLDHLEAGHVLEVVADDLLDLVEHLGSGFPVLEDDVEVEFGACVVHDVGIDALRLVGTAEALLDAGEDVALHIDDAVDLLGCERGDLLHDVLVDDQLVHRFGRDVLKIAQVEGIALVLVLLVYGGVRVVGALGAGGVQSALGHGASFLSD